MDFTAKISIFTVGLALLAMFAALSARGRRTTGIGVWVTFAVLIAIVATLAVILALRHGP